MTEAAATPDPAVVARAAVDRALADVRDLAERPLPEHHDRLAAAHEVLHAALHDRPATG